jgi:hypothetical protein
MKLIKISSRYLVIPEVFGIASAFAAPAQFQFYSNIGCRQSAINTILLQMYEDHLSQPCALIYNDCMHNAGGVSDLESQPMCGWRL